MPRYERDDDRPRRRRGEDDRPPLAKGPSVVVILLIVFGVLVVVCGGAGAAVFFGLMLPAAQKVRQKQEEIQAEQQKAGEENLKAARQPLNNRLTPHNLSRIRAGMTRLQVEEYLAIGTAANASHVTTVTASLPNPTDAGERWMAAHRAGRVYHWQNLGDHILVAYTADPNAGGTVCGVASLLSGLAAEQVRVPAIKP
jgi:uncharacterized membrane protein